MRRYLLLVGVCVFGTVATVTGCGTEGSDGTGGSGGASGAGGIAGGAGTGGIGGAGGTGGAAGCTANIQCAPTEYCRRGDECALPGTCQLRPEICRLPGPDDEVCGCDGNTYPSSCVAASNGASVAFAGPCPDCIDNGDCLANQFCANPDDCEAPGTCATRPDLCIAPMPGDEVCGCDGNTYVNACDARRSGVRIAADGPCP
jgi:hypothetical protein